MEYNRNKFIASLYDCTLSMRVEDLYMQGFDDVIFTL